MAFIDWLRKQHEESERNKALFQGRPMVRAEQAWEGYRDPNPQSRLMVRQPSPTSVTLTEKDDGSSTKVTKWEPEKQLKATALPPGPAVGAPTPLRAKPSFGGLPLDVSRWGGQRGQIENPIAQGMMWKDPTWAGVPQARAAPQPTIRSRVSDPMNTRPGTVGGSLHHPARLADVSNQRAMYHAQRRPYPQVVPPMRGNIGATQSIGVADPDPRMRGMNPSLANVGNPFARYLEQIRRRREGQTMAPFDLAQRFGWGNY